MLNENMRLSIVDDYLSRACHGANVVQNMYDDNDDSFVTCHH